MQAILLLFTHGKHFGDIAFNDVIHIYVNF